ncbi:Pentatricopeptide repeat-containing protein precursor [Actinidia chinensis var. chinensis]|uniref:Pentatricopeptide repeat-containing protein n=1 Tax=Actinidia chinensis var. chinensis TaxID=1590841 RepID=A0A2R6PPA1_ACTCC|nr:Pentatricopeptide repeat-containing protein precursor [Actinidia chinensis var. chinensis]
MSAHRITNMHLLNSIKPISQHALFKLLSPTNKSNPIAPRSMCMKTECFLPPDQSRIVDGLIPIFTKRPFCPDSPKVRDFGSKLTPKIVESVLRSFKNWKIAHLFFNWASQQSGYKHKSYTYNAMASILSRARQNAPLRVLAADLVKSQCWMTPGALGFFLRCLGDQVLVEEANLVFDQVKERGLCVPNNYTYNCLLGAISKSGLVDLVEKRLNEMRDSGWEPDKYTLTPILQCYCNAGKFEKALEVFRSMHEKGWVDSHVLTILVLSFSKLGEVDMAFELIERMEGLNIRLNEKTVCVLIHGFVKESKVDEAIQLFDKMRKLGFAHDISIYGLLMEGLCKNKELEKALYLYSEMKELGIYPDVKILTKLMLSFPEERQILKLVEEMQDELGEEAMILLYNSVLNGLVTNGSVDKAYSLLRAMMGDEGNGDVEMDELLRIKKPVRPNTSSFEVVISGLCQIGQLDIALGLFQDMDRINCKGSLLLYNNLIDSLSNSDRVEECYKIMREMKKSGFQPTQFTYNSIFGCLGGREDVAGALSLLKEMRVNGHEPWVKHTALLVKKLCKHGKVAEASNFLSSMVQEGFLPDIIPYSAAIDGFVKIQDMDHALQLFRDIGARGYCADVVAYNIIINGLCKAGRVSEALDVLNEMLEKGLVPSVVTYNSLIDGWCKSGDIDRAMLCLSTMAGKEREPSVVTYTTLINGLCNAGRPNDALELWNKMRETGCSPNRIAFMALINGLCKCAKPDDALVYFKEMEEKDMTADTYVYAALMDAFLSNSNPLLAIDILKRMLHRGILPDAIDGNHQLIREAIFKLSKDSITSSEIEGLVAEGRISIVYSLSDVVSEDGDERVS